MNIAYVIKECNSWIAVISLYLTSLGLCALAWHSKMASYKTEEKELTNMIAFAARCARMDNRV
jgi:hypothetical protein